MSDYTVGEILKIGPVIARVADVSLVIDSVLIAHIEHESGEYRIEIPLGVVPVQRHTPAGGPVRAGDVWRDIDGYLWLAIETAGMAGPVLSMQGSRARAGVNARPEAVHEMYRLVELVHREPEPEQDDAETGGETRG